MACPHSFRTAAAMAFLAAATHCQTTLPAFEVASVKPVTLDPARLKAGLQHVGVTIDAARVDFGAITMANLIRTAWQVKGYQVVGPDWMNVERYDIVARMPEGSRRAQIPQMLQTLLAERFQLALHRESRDLPAFALAAAKSGPKLKPSPEESAAGSEGGGEVFRSNSTLSQKGTVTNSGPDGAVVQTIGPHGMHLEMRQMTMPALCGHLIALTGKSVTDMTQLKGRYDFALDLSREEVAALARASGQAPPPAPGGDRDPAALLAVDPDEKSLAVSLGLLGLRLESRRLPVEVLVIDRVERVPVEN